MGWEVRRPLGALLVALLGALLGAATAAAARAGGGGWPLEVRLPGGGVVRGAQEVGHEAWWGIPYAEPPMGERRFAAPVPAAPWEGARDCSRDAARRCLRLSLKWSEQLDPRKQATVVGQEDCLYLNIFRPSSAMDSAGWDALPVLAYIHGGGFKSGDPPEGGTYHFWKLAEDVGQIVVSLEYRLGPMGFLALEELRSEEGGVGNYGLQDQRLALAWIQENILAFGGDPSRVTVFGESAGAMSICSHVGSPSTKGLFSGAIIQSGNCDSPLVFATADRGLAGGRALRDAVGCGSLKSESATRECMRSALVSDILHFSASNRENFPLFPIIDWAPVVDGVTVERLPLEAVQMGAFNDETDVIIGSAKNDGSMFAAALPLFAGQLRLPQTMLRDFLLRVFGADKTKAILNEFPSKGLFGTPKQVTELITGYLFRCPARRFSRALASKGRDAWLYEFAYKFSGRKYKLLGDYHTSENKWLFGGKGKDLDLKGSDAEMQAALQGYWGTFAAAGDPNIGARSGGEQTTLPPWPAVSAEQTRFMVLTENPTIHPDVGNLHGPGDKACDFWDTLQPPQEF